MHNIDFSELWSETVTAKYFEESSCNDDNQKSLYSDSNQLNEENSADFKSGFSSREANLYEIQDLEFNNDCNLFSDDDVYFKACLSSLNNSKLDIQDIDDFVGSYQTPESHNSVKEYQKEMKSSSKANSMLDNDCSSKNNQKENISDTSNNNYDDLNNSKLIRFYFICRKLAVSKIKYRL